MQLYKARLLVSCCPLRQAFVRKNCKELVPTADISLPNSLMATLSSLMDEFRDAKQVRRARKA